MENCKTDSTNENQSNKNQSILPFVLDVSCGCAAIAVLLVFGISIMNADLGIKLNHTLINLLPDSFDPLKFDSQDSEVIQQLQLVFVNLPLLPMNVFYWCAFTYVIATYAQRTVFVNIYMLAGVYGFFYIVGAGISALETGYLTP